MGSEIDGRVEQKRELYASLGSLIFEVFPVVPPDWLEGPIAIDARRGNQQSVWFENVSQRHSLIADLASRQSAVEYINVVFHFESGDTISTPVRIGNRSTVSVPYKDMKTLLEGLKNGKFRVGDGNTRGVEDLRFAEVVHNHPMSYAIKYALVDPNGAQGAVEFWDGPLSWSSKDITAQIDIGYFLSKSIGRELPVRFTIISPFFQAIVYN
jgi:hypothetical protein